MLINLVCISILMLTVLASFHLKDNESAKIKEHMDKFSDRLTTLLRERFKNHWYEDKPHKGQGYRLVGIESILLFNILHSN